MSDVFFLALRRLRAPLILLLLVYSVATLGLVMIPGQDDSGAAWRMSFFHAFYFVSFMGSTIGFGEIPYAFTDAQRAWVLVCIYISVIAWLYAIGNVLALVQDKTFQQAIAERRFQTAIQRIEQPFYIICGFGETGMLINKSLSQLGILTVIIDLSTQNTNSLELENLRFAPIVLNADGSDPKMLLKAGINRRFCQGVIAVTQNDHTNLEIAVSCKLLNDKVPMLCRSEIEDEAANMASFGTDVIVNPYTTFAHRLNLLAHKPALHRIQNWLINQRNPEYITDRELPRGRWIMCGFGRLGKAIAEHVSQEGIELVVVDPDPISSGAPGDAIVGRGTEAETLQQAGIADACLVVASSDDDANNLSVLITAKQLNPEVYTIGRVSRETNQLLFRQVGCDYIMRRGQLVANEVITSISRPLVGRFVKYSNNLSESDTQNLITEINRLTGGKEPVSLRLSLTKRDAPALTAHLESGHSLNVNQVCKHSRLPQGRCIPLLLLRKGVSQLLPSHDTSLQVGDQLLVCGSRKHLLLPERLADNPELVDSFINRNPHHIPLLRWTNNKTEPA